MGKELEVQSRESHAAIADSRARWDAQLAAAQQTPPPARFMGGAAENIRAAGDPALLAQADELTKAGKHVDAFNLRKRAFERGANAPAVPPRPVDNRERVTVMQPDGSRVVMLKSDYEARQRAAAQQPSAPAAPTQPPDAIPLSELLPAEHLSGLPIEHQRALEQVARGETVDVSELPAQARYGYEIRLPDSHGLGAAEIAMLRNARAANLPQSAVDAYIAAAVRNV
jgi:hypothetical protein